MEEAIFFGIVFTLFLLLMVFLNRKPKSRDWDWEELMRQAEEDEERSKR